MRSRISLCKSCFVLSVTIFSLSVKADGGDNHALAIRSALAVPAQSGPPAKLASTTVISPLAEAATGAKIDITATVTPGNAAGTVTFKEGLTSLGTVALNGAGVATFSISTLSAGTHVITASYSGDQNVAPSDSASVSVTIKDAVPIPVIGIARTGSLSNVLISPITTLTSDTCLTVVPQGAQLMEGDERVDLAALIKKPGTHTLTVKDANGKHDAKVAIIVVQAIQKILFASDAAQIFAGQAKDFAQSLTVNDDNAILSEMRSRTPSVPLPTFVWTVKDANGGEHPAINGIYTENTPNARDTITVVAKNRASSSCEANDQNKDQSAEQIFVALPSPGTLYVDPVRSTLLPGATLKLTADARLQGGESEKDALIEWKILAPDPTNDPNKFISIEPPTGLSVNAVAHFSVADLAVEKALQKPVAIQAIWRNAKIKDATSPSNPTTTAYLIPQMVMDFRPIKVKLEPVDDETSEALFGSGMQKNFWIMRIRLNNNLRNEANATYLGSSILVFSESMEMAVSLEKKYNKRSHSDHFKKASDPKDKGEKAEKQVFSDEERSYIFDDADDIGPDKKIIKEWTPVSARRDFEGFLDINPEYASGIKNPKPLPLGTRGSRVRPGGKLEVWEPGDDAGRLVCRSDFFYRPYSYEIVLNTVSSLEEKSGRAVTFKIANAIGLVASVVTAVAVPGKGSDLPRGLDKFSNIFVPGVQKLWKDMSDSHRQNLVSMTMKPIEEIPFGAEISKMVFFPKQPFAGMVRGHYTRISQVCPYYFHATAAVLNSDSGANSNQPASTQPPASTNPR
jgi:hypothetical protein